MDNTPGGFCLNQQGGLLLVPVFALSLLTGIAGSVNYGYSNTTLLIEHHAVPAFDENFLVKTNHYGYVFHGQHTFGITGLYSMYPAKSFDLCTISFFENGKMQNEDVRTISRVLRVGNPDCRFTYLQNGIVSAAASKYTGVFLPDNKRGNDLSY